VVRTARSQIGSRYAWAGCSPDQGFDCSGLVWWAYDQSGISLPRISNDQLRAGAPVSQDRLAPADLVFFQTGKNERSIHVGIYTGDGYFVHSPNHGQRVREESMRAKYWRARFIGARRVVEERAAPVQAAQSGQPARVAPAGEQQ
jgi:cell wall-associated NlpC family hydrolase